MYVDLELLKALESAWSSASSGILELDVGSIRDAVGGGLPGSLTEESLRTDVVGEAFGVAARHFEALAALTRGTHNDYVVTESLFVKHVQGVLRR